MFQINLVIDVKPEVLAVLQALTGASAPKALAEEVAKEAPQEAAPRKRATKPTTNKVDEPTQAVEETAEITETAKPNVEMAEIRKLFIELAQNGFKAKVAEFLTKHGASKLPELSMDKYDEFYNDLKSIA